MRLRVLAVSVLVLAALAGWLWLPRAIEKPIEDEPTPEHAAVEEAPLSSPVGERSAVRAASEALPEAPAIAREVRGTVVDPAGTPVADVRVRETAEDSEGSRTGPDGVFVLRPLSEDWSLAVDEKGWTTLRPATFEDAIGPEGVRILAAHATVVDGRVVDREGPPLPGARIELRCDEAAAAWTFSAGFEGRFRAEGVPAVRGLRAAASLAGWRTAELVLDLPSSEETVFVLDREDPGSPVIDGDVVHADGSPAANALVAFGAARTRTDARGAFRLVCGGFDERTPLVAIERGLEPAVLDGFGASFQSPSPPARQHLVLAGPARRLAGRVVDAHGQPCKGFEVHLLGATLLDPGGASRDVAELEAGGPIRLRTDAHGAFRFGGLRDRAYGVLASGARRSTREVVLKRDGIPSGTLDLEIVVPDDAGRAPIRGRVLDPSGAPVAAVRVGLGRAVPPGDPGEFGRIGGRAATTGPDGRFELPDAPAGLAYLVASADGFVPSRFELPIGSARDAIEIRVRPRREIRIDASRASPAPDSARALDGSGRAIPFWSGTTALPIVPLRAGIAEPIGASGDTRSVVLSRGGREVARLPMPPGTGPVDLVWP